MCSKPANAAAEVPEKQPSLKRLALVHSMSKAVGSQTMQKLPKTREVAKLLNNKRIVQIHAARILLRDEQKDWI